MGGLIVNSGARGWGASGLGMQAAARRTREEKNSIAVRSIRRRPLCGGALTRTAENQRLDITRGKENKSRPLAWETRQARENRIGPVRCWNLEGPTLEVDMSGLWRAKDNTNFGHR